MQTQSSHAPHHPTLQTLTALLGLLLILTASGLQAQDLLETWHFEGDLSSSGPAVTTAHGSTSYMPGKVGQAFRIDRQGGYATIDGLGHRLGTGPFAISMWTLYHGRFIDHVRHEHLFTSGWTGRYRAIDLFGERYGGSIYFWANGFGTQIIARETAPWIQIRNQWHHVVFGRDAQRQYLCVNGRLMMSGPISRPFDHRTVDGRAYLGYNPAENRGRSFPGAFDELYVYNDWVGEDGCAWLYENPGNPNLPGPCVDLDGDGYGNPGNTECPAGPQTDCDDTDARVFPGATEDCNGIDDNCNGEIDEGFDDTDGDAAADCVDPDDDNDGIDDHVDACPVEFPPGPDADVDGCTDTLDRLGAAIKSLGLPRGTENSLLAKARAALASCGRGNTSAAANQLGALGNQVAALAGNQIDLLAAATLIDYLDNVTATLSCP